MSSEDVFLRMARAVSRLEIAPVAVVFIGLADADAIMAARPGVAKMNANQILRSLEGRPEIDKFDGEAKVLTCCGHLVRLDRQLEDGVIEIEIGPSHDRIKQIESRRTLPDGSGV